MAIDIPGGRGHSMYIMGGIGLAVVWTTLSFRVWSRWFLLRKWGYDDYLMVAAVVCYSVMAGGMFALANNGFGQPASTLSPETLVALYKATLVGELGYVIGSTLFRLCVCFFYLRLTMIIWHVWTIRIVMVITTVYSIAYWFILLNQCTPVSFFWTQFRGDTSGHCLSAAVVIGSTYAHNSVSAAGDWILNSLPLFIIIPSLMDWKTKISALLLLCLGLVGSVAIVVRFIALTTITPASTAVPLAPPVAFWSALELCVGILAANVATYRPLFRSLVESVKSAISSGQQKSPSKHISIPRLSQVRWPGSWRRRSGTSYILGRSEPGSENIRPWPSHATSGGTSTNTKAESCYVFPEAEPTSGHEAQGHGESHQNP